MKKLVLENPEAPKIVRAAQRLRGVDDRGSVIFGGGLFGGLVALLLVLGVDIVRTGGSADGDWIPLYTWIMVGFAAAPGGIVMLAGFVAGLGRLRWRDLEFKTASHKDAYIEFHGLSESDREDASTAYRAFEQVMPGAHDFWDVHSTWMATLNFVRERAERRRLEVGNVYHEEAKAVLEQMREIEKKSL
jgi:hypothetical protein